MSVLSGWHIETTSDGVLHIHPMDNVNNLTERLSTTAPAGVCFGSIGMGCFTCWGMEDPEDRKAVKLQPTTCPAGGVKDTPAGTPT